MNFYSGLCCFPACMVWFLREGDRERGRERSGGMNDLALIFSSVFLI